MIRIALTIELLVSFVPVISLLLMGAVVAVSVLQDSFLGFLTFGAPVLTGVFGLFGMAKLARIVLFRPDEVLGALGLIQVVVGISTVLYFFTVMFHPSNFNPLWRPLILAPVICASHFFFIVVRRQMSADNQQINQGQG